MNFNLFTAPTVTMTTAGVLGVIYLILSMRIVFFRVNKKISLGVPADSKDPMFKLNRVHGNFSEYIPFLLFMMFLLDITRSNPLLLKISGGALILGRILHWLGIINKRVPNWQRMLGAGLTFTVMGIFSIALIWKGIS